jgi:formate hydrogenlyase subunit 3/multisubunit Na+/H+ antiporter MnhD subunit
MYLLAIPFRAFFLAPALGVPVDRVREAPWPLLAAMMLTAGACVALFFVPEPLYRLAAALVEGRS